MSYLIEGPLTAEVIGGYLEKIHTLENCGGHSSFVGVVRADVSDGRRVIAIEYSAYEAMVGLEAAQIREAILAGFDDVHNIEIAHSTGIVKTGEASLFVIVSAGHRRQAMEACSAAVEMIKERLPVWKKEIYDDNSHIWQENKPY
jgi:molybdopterin synthase catalytic subunit